MKPLLPLDERGPLFMDTSMGESNTIVSSYTLYKHLQ